MNPLRLTVLLLLIQVAPAPPVPATGSVEGVVLRLGTTTPIAGADVELSRVEGTAAAPLTPEAIETFSRALVGGGNNRALVPAAIVNEVRYIKTGPDGRFAFKDLKEGKYRLVSIRIGGMYQPAEFGQRDPQGRGYNFPLAVGQAIKDLRLEMAPTGAITGKVTDDNGQPIGHARVSALVPRVENGRRYLAVVDSVHSDEKGNYRLFWLTPGRYYVAARLEDLSRRAVGLLTFPPGRIISSDDASTPILSRRVTSTGEMEDITTGFVYYGGVLDPERARPLDLLPGQTYEAADIPLGLGRMPAWHIRGTVLNSSGQPAKGAGLRAIPRQWSPNVQVLVGTADPNGNFDLVGAVQGSYAIFATTQAPPILTEVQRSAYAALGLDPDRVVQGLTSEIGYAAVDVGTGNVSGIKFNTTRGVGITGKVSIEGRLPSPQGDPELAKVVVTVRRDPNIVYMPDAMVPLPLPSVAPGATALPQRPVNGQVGADGKFYLLASIGDFQVDVNGIPANAYVKTIRMGNVDILSGGLQLSGPPDDPVDVVLGTDGGEISGTAVSDRMEPMTNVIVAIVPESPLLRRRYDLYRSTPTDYAGRFRLRNIPPGTYKIFSWEYVEYNSWQDAQFLQSYETAGKLLTVREGSSQDIQVKVTPLRR